MAKAKRDKSRQKQLTNYKNKHKSKKMSNVQPPKNPIANQYPMWQAQDTIEMNGLEFEALNKFINIFREAVMANESIVQKNTQSGKITWKFEGADGKELPKEVIENYQKEIQAFFLAQQKAQQVASVKPNEAITAEEQKVLPRIDALVDTNGQELKS